jgi:dolichol-phosphate mannosyltransferase
VDEEIKKNPGIHLIRRPKKMGLGTAYVQGFTFFMENGYDLVFEMDADLSHDPGELPRFVKASRKFDLVIGSRYIPGGGTPNWGGLRKAVSALGNAYARAILGCSFSDLTSGFRCYRSAAPIIF